MVSLYVCFIIAYKEMGIAYELKYTTDQKEVARRWLRTHSRAEHIMCSSGDGIRGFGYCARCDKDCALPEAQPVDLMVVGTSCHPFTQGRAGICSPRHQVHFGPPSFLELNFT